MRALLRAASLLLPLAACSFAPDGTGDPAGCIEPATMLEVLGIALEIAAPAAEAEARVEEERGSWWDPGSEDYAIRLDEANAFLRDNFQVLPEQIERRSVTYSVAAAAAAEMNFPKLKGGVTGSLGFHVYDQLTGHEQAPREGNSYLLPESRVLFLLPYSVEDRIGFLEVRAEPEPRDDRLWLHAIVCEGRRPGA